MNGAFHLKCTTSGDDLQFKATYEGMIMVSHDAGSNPQTGSPSIPDGNRITLAVNDRGSEPTPQSASTAPPRHEHTSHSQRTRERPPAISKRRPPMRHFH